jgi:PTS system N-acetylgalactosamine-specific IIA component
MKYVVMVSHGTFAPGLHSAVQMMTGPREDVLDTSLLPDMSADTFQENFRKLVKPIKPEDEIILLADILSGSPFTKALEVLAQNDMLPNTVVLAGMNMPMALTAVLMKDNIDDRKALVETILSEGKNGLLEFTTADDSGSDEDI